MDTLEQISQSKVNIEQLLRWYVHKSLLGLSDAYIIMTKFEFCLFKISYCKNDMLNCRSQVYGKTAYLMHIVVNKINYLNICKTVI
jgi:hypothetical protein